MSSEIKVNSIQDKTGTRTLVSDSGSAWSWGAGVPSGTILNVHQSVNQDIYSQTTTDFDFITINTTFNGTKLYLIGMVSATAVTAGQNNAAFRFMDNTTHLTGASGDNNGGSWTEVASSTNFKDAERASNLSASFLYTHGQSTPYTTTIKIRIINTASSYNYKLNRPADNDANNSTVRSMSASSLTIFDIK